MRSLFMVVLVIAVPAIPAEMLTAHHEGKNDHVAPQPVKLKLTA